MTTEKQVQGLRYLIINSKDSSELTKRICLFLIDSSKGLTKSLVISINTKNGFSKKELGIIMDEVHNMKSANGSTFLNEICTAMGTKFRLSYCMGTGTPRKKVMTSRTFWWSPENYDHKAHNIEVSRKEIDKIELKSGLYKSE